jgi:hypothetical protein
MKQSDGYGITGLLCLTQISNNYAIFAAALAFIIAIVCICRDE